KTAAEPAPKAFPEPAPEPVSAPIPESRPETLPETLPETGPPAWQPAPAPAPARFSPSLFDQESPADLRRPAGRSLPSAPDFPDLPEAAALVPAPAVLPEARPYPASGPDPVFPAPETPGPAAGYPASAYQAETYPGAEYRPDLRQLRHYDLRTQFNTSVPMNMPSAGLVTEVNADKHQITVREIHTGSFFSGCLQPANVSWSLIKMLFERGEKEIMVDFLLRPNADSSLGTPGTPILTDVKYALLDDKISRGLSVWFHDIIYMPKKNSGPSAPHPTFEQMLERLAQFAQPEKWYYSNHLKPYNLLENYFLKTFQNLQKEKISRFLDIFSSQNRLADLPEVNDSGIGFSSDLQLAAFNTGLLDQGSRDILVVFKKTEPAQKRYVFKGFTSSSDNPLGKEVSTRIHPRPKRTVYFQKHEEIIYQNSAIDLDHDAQCSHIIIDGIKRGRFPYRFISNICPSGYRYAEDSSFLQPEDVEAVNNQLTAFIHDEPSQSTYITLKEKLKTSLELTHRQIVANPRIPLPYWNPARDKLAFILPLALTDPREYDVALVVEQITDTDGGVVKHFVHTVLTLSMACKGARLISSLQDTWLGKSRDQIPTASAAPGLQSPKPDFPRLAPAVTPPQPKRLITPASKVPNLGLRPPVQLQLQSPARSAPLPAAPAPVPQPPKRVVPYQDIKTSFSEEMRYYAYPSSAELAPAFLAKVFEFCWRFSGKNGSEKLVPLPLFHEILIQIVPRLAPDQGGYKGFNSAYSDLTSVFELYRDTFGLRKNRLDRVKYIYLHNESREQPKNGSNGSSSSLSQTPGSLRQGVISSQITDKNSVIIFEEDGTERRARIKDSYELYLIGRLLARSGSADVAFSCAQTLSRADFYDSSKRGLFYEVTDVRSTEIDPDFRAVLNTNFPTEFFSEMVTRL
ncbi:MAG: DUF3825 domain-containing protein, partial [Deltaproteobacteria bacterium]|nr:DUF3825 domain-containing protein [Deltaproteobacteria bacterium]